MMKKFYLLLFLSLLSCFSLAEISKPNVIIILTDDQGYEDVGVFGSPLIDTPHLDKMAKDGLQFTDFYVASSVCSASRAALLSGQRGAVNGITGVLWPGGEGMKPEVLTIAELLKPRGYATAAFGKWHLGDQDHTRPTSQGFDEYYGIPYSNDMFIHPSHRASKNIQFNFGYNLERFHSDQKFVKTHYKNKKKLKKDLNYGSPIFETNEVVEYPADQSKLTEKYFERTRKFISKNKNKPFFIFLTPAMPHIPLYASDKFKGKSKRGLYGDVIEEIDYEVGKLRTHLEKLKLDRETLIIFTSDNGPWLSFKEDGGSAGPFRDGKFTNFEGGVRVPAIFYWPNTIAANRTSNEIISTLDLFSTIAEISGAQIPVDHFQDGQSIASFLKNPAEELQRDTYFYNLRDKIAGVRKANYKYIRPKMSTRKKGADKKAMLFDLNKDPSESENLAQLKPELVSELEALIKSYEAKMPNR